MNSKNGTKTITLQELMSTISEEQVKQSQQMYGGVTLIKCFVISFNMQYGTGK